MIKPIDLATFKGTPLPTAVDLAIIAKINEIVAVVNGSTPTPASNVAPPVPPGH